jgi:hypothetical protein
MAGADLLPTLLRVAPAPPYSLLLPLSLSNSSMLPLPSLPSSPSSP